MAFVNVDNAGYGSVGYNYRIGTYAVTAAQWADVYAADPNVGRALFWSGSQPAAGMTWYQMAKFCNWLTTGNALNGYYGDSATPNALSHDAYAASYGTTYFIPTENEWYKAAYYSGSGSTYYLYPTGSNSVPTAVHSGTSAGTAVFGNVASSPASVDNAGALSPYGTMGQGGNVWEWNETAIGSLRGMRGGDWQGEAFYLASSYRNAGNPPTATYYNAGFRVASVAVNVAPVLDEINNKSVDEQAPLTFTATASDQDRPDQTLSFNLDAAAIALGMSITPGGDFAWTPSEDQGGTSYAATITVTDDGTPNLDDWEMISITVDAIVPKVIDLGQVDFRLLDHLSLAGSHFYRIRTVHDGMLSLQVDTPTPPKSARLKLYDDNPVETVGLTPLEQSALDEDANQRIDWAVAAGETYYIEVYGSNDNFDLRIANVVQHVGTTVTVQGTDGDDVFAFAPTGSYQVTINGVSYHFDDADVNTVQFDGGEGNDTASIDDSSGNDVYTATPNYAQIVAPDFTVRAESCATVFAYARQGGDDTAVFIDSLGNDKAKAENGTTVKMYDSSRSYFHRAKFFEKVEVNFSEGGAKGDARLWDSPASDIFDGMPGNCRYYSEDTAFDVTVLGADFATVYSINGGDDQLILHDSPNDDVFRGKAHKVELFDRATGGTVHKITARQFKDIAAYADQGGRDIAKLYDSTLDDLWEAEYRQGETWSKMTSTNRALYEAMAFEQVKGYSLNGGTDTLKKRIGPSEIDFVLTHGDWKQS